MEMNIRDHWDMLSPETRHWLTDNPGCVVLPRTITEIIHQETGITPDADRHSQVSLSPEDLSFIRAKAEEAPARPK
ncbi:hypothetical protein [Arthrobacter sp. B2a2-09]|uniref:hypothetical protein n=1 Tax=Arthrobacter sp. B2a2-09 TaxID=2952822 RepID=UPI0022CDB00D|nr:hypothetical protein [Arthrobacter sp. B2a2-09]MCZ9880414.1 hypothetical protein [Arthrobacter sp. B2a2-09]